MVRLAISEFTFGFAFLFEQVNKNWQGLVGFPVLPSLQQEADEGWDARLPLQGTDFYYQFKLSDYLSYRHAKYIREGPYDAPYFRIALHPHQNNQQHRRLKQHAIYNENTYYVAPEIKSPEEFNQAFLDRKTAEVSRLIPLRECVDYNENDREQHYITFQPGSDGFTQHSPPLRRSGDFSGSRLGGVYSDSRARWHPINDAFASALYDRALASVAKVRAGEEDIEEEEAKELPELASWVRRRPRTGRRKDLLQSASDILATYFGLTMVIVGER